MQRRVQGEHERGVGGRRYMREEEEEGEDRREKGGNRETGKRSMNGLFYAKDSKH